ncbi:MAG: ABC transporter ATP-binding protein [Pseudomonadota bacterium]
MAFRHRWSFSFGTITKRNAHGASAGNLMSMTSKTRLSARDVTIGYGGAPVLTDVTLDIESGEIVILVGPNGCGKSTLLKTIARVLKPQSGHVLLDGNDIRHMNTRKVARRLALLPQGPVAPEGLLVHELVALGRFPYQTALRQWSRADADAVAEAMVETNTSDYADTPVAQLSGGQRQRCWIAMVLAQGTDLILLDEPTTFLDLKVQIDLMSLLLRLARTGGRTLLIVLHELNVAAAFADRLVVMREGRIFRSGPPSEILSEGLLKQAFDLDAQIIADPSTGRPVCIPIVPDISDTGRPMELRKSA